MKYTSIEIGADVFINAVPVAKQEHEGDQYPKDDDPSKVLSMTLETFSSVAVADAGGVRHEL